MKWVAQILAVLVLLALIGFVVWNDWFDGSFRAPTPEAPADQRVEEEIVGIGAVLKSDEETGLVRIMSVLPNSPASKAGLPTDVLIQKINDSQTDELPLKQCVELIRGPVGTKLRLQVWNPETNVTNLVELTRERVAVPRLPVEF